MSSFWKAMIISLAFATTLGLVTPAFAQDAKAHVDARHKELVAALKEPASPARARKIATLIDNMLDYDRLADDSLGKHRTDRTDAEMTEFREVLKKLVRRNYESNIQKTLNYDVTITGESGNDSAKVVTTTAKSTKPGDSQETISIDYKLHKKDGKWFVYDIVTEKSSLLNNYKNQFNKTITTNGWGALVTKLKNKLNGVRVQSPG